MHALTIVWVLLGILGIAGLVLAVAFAAWAIGSGFFGDDPGGRDPRRPGQFGLSVPKYVEFLREKQRLIRKSRKKY